MLSFSSVVQRQSRSGFTLVELIVAMGIMITIMGITLSNRPDAISRLALADEVSSANLLLRQSQLQGSSINSLDGTYGGAGVYFDRATSTKIIFFKDRVDQSIESALGVGDGVYSQVNSLEFSNSLSLTRRNHVAKLCVSMSTSTLLCNEQNTVPVQNLTVSFNRPSVEANIYINNATDTKYTAGCVEFNGYKAPADGFIRSVFVYKSGMMETKVGPCL